MQEIERRSGGAWRPSPGSVYPALQQLEDEGLVRAEEAAGRGKLFHLTEEGRSHVTEHADELGTPWEDVAGGGEQAAELRGLIFGVGAAVMQVVQAGNDEQVAAAGKVLEDARRALYRILAEDDPAA
jgi:DNA-binding PadR family transcriptional regulator